MPFAPSSFLFLVVRPGERPNCGRRSSVPAWGVSPLPTAAAENPGLFTGRFTHEPTNQSTHGESVRPPPSALSNVNLSTALHIGHFQKLWPALHIGMQFWFWGSRVVRPLDRDPGAAPVIFWICAQSEGDHSQHI